MLYEGLLSEINLKAEEDEFKRYKNPKKQNEHIYDAPANENLDTTDMKLYVKKGTPNLFEAVSKSSTQLQRVYKAGIAAGSGKWNHNRKNPGEAQDQLDSIRWKARKLALRDKNINPKLKYDLMTPSQGVGDVATEKALGKGIRKGKTKKKRKVTNEGKMDRKHDGLMYDPKTGKRRPASVKKGKWINNNPKKFRLVQGPWKKASELDEVRKGKERLKTATAKLGNQSLSPAEKKALQKRYKKKPGRLHKDADLHGSEYVGHHVYEGKKIKIKSKWHRADSEARREAAQEHADYTAARDGGPYVARDIALGHDQGNIRDQGGSRQRKKERGAKPRTANKLKLKSK
jgi:hypothetical protein